MKFIVVSFGVTLVFWILHTQTAATRLIRQFEFREIMPMEFRYRPKNQPMGARLILADSRERSQCYQSYRRFYAKPTIDIRVVFGYKDARPAYFVGDRYERLMLTAYLIAPCQNIETACGFRRNDNDSDLFYKYILGPDGLEKRVEIRVTHSSVGPDDRDNRINPHQEWQSTTSRLNFVSGLRSADAVFYNGHSRDGGGPDFEPPRLIDDGHVDYEWYLTHRPGERMILESLLGSKTQILGLISCLSTTHFQKKIRATNPSIATISSPQLLFYSDALRGLLGALSAILGQWCQDEVVLALGTLDDRSRLVLSGFFKLRD